MPPTAESIAVEAMEPRELADELSRLESTEPLDSERITAIKARLEELAHQELEAPTEQAALEAAAALAEAEEPDRPEGAADDEWEYDEPEGQQRPAEEPPVAGAEDPPDLEPLENLETSQLVAICENDAATFPDAGHYEVPAAWQLINDLAAADDEEAKAYVAEVAARAKDASGIAADEAEAQSAEVEPAGEEVSGELFPVPTAYDAKLYAELIGGEQPTEQKISIKGLPSLELENAPAHLKKGDVLEIRCRVQVTGGAFDDKLKFDLEDQQLHISKTVEKRTLTVTAAAVVDD